MDIPASINGKIEEIIINVGDNVSEGDVIFKVSSSDSDTKTEETAPAEVEKTASSKKIIESPSEESSSNQTAIPQEIQITVPDLGGADEVEVIELLVAVGDEIEKDQAVITVESDKASMDVPTSHAGTITAISINIGDKINEGDNIITINSSDASIEKSTVAKPATEPMPNKKTEIAPEITQTQQNKTPKPTEASTPEPASDHVSHASPSVRRLARELGVNLSQVVGSARKNRITKSDIKAFAKGIISSGANSSSAVQNNQTTGSGNGIPEIPTQDFTKFGEVEVQPLNKIKRITANHLHRSWLNIPHVTHNDESNIASLEDFRKTLNAENAKAKNGVKLSPLAFIVKAVVKSLQTFPQFNSSLENGGENLILKNYYNIGIAVETPNGLVVPVIKNADQLNVTEIAQAMGVIAQKARDGKLKANDMQGGTFTISSLGGIGGTHFTPIVNAPEVAILGISRTKIQPIWNGTEFEPAPVLPLSLSYDHRVIDGAEAARFTRHVAAALEDIRRLTV
jgi:pyruvate dehydrogenase E2 component (dihydrolipoamide acetyltransferase)